MVKSSCDVHANVGSVASDFTLESTQESATLSHHRGRRNILLYFMADFTDSRAWHELFLLEQLAGRLRAANTVVFAIGNGRYLRPATQLARESGISIPLLGDGVDRLRQKYLAGSSDIERHSLLVLIDREGRIRYRQRTGADLPPLDTSALLASAAGLPQPRDSRHQSAIARPFACGLTPQGTVIPCRT